MLIHPQEALLQQARALQQSADYDEYPARRVVVEHRLVQLGIRQSRYFGRVKTKFQLYLAATVANLTLVLGNIGLSGSTGGGAAGHRVVLNDVHTVVANAAANFSAVRLGQLWSLFFLTSALPPKSFYPNQGFPTRFLGVNLISRIATLREEGRLPIRSIQWYLRTVHQLRLSVGAIVSAIHQTAQQAQPAVTAMVDCIRASPVFHADETGWRQNGNNGYVWTFSTPNERYFLRRGRGKAVVDEALGEAFSGVLVSDFYAAYHHYDGPKQRCWAHLLRDIHDLVALYLKDAPLARWAAAVHRLYEEAKAFSHPQARRRRTAQLALERKLLAICQPFLADPLAVQAKLCRRIERHIKELFVFVAEPDVPADNNAAERSSHLPPASSGHQPQGQRRHPLGAGHREQDDAGIHLRHLARPRTKKLSQNSSRC